MLLKMKRKNPNNNNNNNNKNPTHQTFAPTGGFFRDVCGGKKNLQKESKIMKWPKGEIRLD